MLLRTIIAGAVLVGGAVVAIDRWLHGDFAAPGNAAIFAALLILCVAIAWLYPIGWLGAAIAIVLVSHVAMWLGDRR